MRDARQGFHQVRETPASKDLCLQVLVALICPSASAHSQGRSKSCVLVLLDAVVVVAFVLIVVFFLFLALEIEFWESCTGAGPMGSFACGID